MGEQGYLAEQGAAGETAPGLHRVTRRGLITAAGLGLAAAACGGESPWSASRGTAIPRALATTTSAPTTTLPAPPTTMPNPEQALTTVPVSAIPVQAKPAFYVTDLLPTAPPNAIALTIDDGPDPRYTPHVLDLLKANGMVANFSVIGIYAAKFPDLIQRILAEGHSIVNHTMHHLQPFDKLPAPQLQTEVVGGLEAVLQSGKQAPTLFRSPGGSWTPAIYALIAELGMRPLDWNIDPQDWTRPGTPHIVQVMERAKPNDIVLCHDGGGDRSETVAALATALPVLKGKGLVTVKF